MSPLTAFFRKTRASSVTLALLLASPAAFAQAGLVAAYGFNEGAGSTVADSSGQGNGGTIAAATWVATGKFGPALNFNGTSAMVTIADAASLDLTNNMTVEAWVNPQSGSGWRTVVMKEISGGLAYSLYSRGTSNVPSGYVNIGGADRAAAGTTGVALNTWTHLAATYNGANLRLYVNGVERANISQTGNIAVSTLPLRIGGNAPWGEYFKGMIDEVRVYNRALSVAEIQTDMNTPIQAVPTITISSPAGGATVAGQITVTASASAPSGVAGVLFKLDNNDLGAEVTTAPYSVAWSTTNVADGSHTLTAVLRDGSGMSTTSAPVIVNVVNTVQPPSVSITAPASGANVSGTGTTVSASASAPGGVAGVTFMLDGNNIGSEDTTSPYSVSWNTTGVSNGQHVLTARVRAVSGATATSAQVPVNVNNAAPTISITAPASGATVSATISVTATATAPGGVAGVTFKLDGNNIGSEDTTSPYSVSWNTTTASAGAHVLTAVVRATNGTTVTSSQVNVTVNNNPTVSITAPASGANVSGTTTVSASASAPGGVAGVTFKLDGNNIGSEDTSSPYSVSWNTTGASNGQHTLTAVVRATGGATATSTDVIVNVNNAAPSVSISAPASGANVSGTTTVSASASAPGGVAGVTFKLDGNNIGSEDTTSPYSVSWNTTGASNGQHTLTAVVRATGGATATSSDVIVNVANVAPPTVTMTSPSAGNVNGSVTLSATASDDLGIAGVQFLVDGNSVGAEDTEAPYTMSWDSTTIANGTHAISARARNTLGGTATASAVSVNVSNGPNPATMGQWSSVINWPIVPLDTILLKTGKVLVYDRVSAGPTARVWDPVTDTFVNVPNNFTDLFCTGHSILADGRVLLVGGHGPVNAGTADVNIFDPVAMTWTLAPRMAYERWYPSSVLLPNGKVFTFTGTATTVTDYVTVPELYDPIANTWSKVNSAAANMYMYGQAFVLPNGKLGYAGNWEFDDNARVLDLNTGTWTVVDSTPTAGYSVMYEPGKILKVGSSADSGTGGSSAKTAYLLDFTAASPSWQSIAPMQYPRTHHNLTILPNGEVFVTGGSTMKEGYLVSNAVLTPEMWSPETKTFRPMAPHVKPRLYHSGALLLPDGRVLVSGGGRDGTGVDQFNVEIYSPPYLFKGARPTVTSAPSTVEYGSTFLVGTPDAANVASVSLLRLGSVTHSINFDQRFMKLNFQATAGGVNITAPANANLAPPGPYMIFLVNTDGVPSVATFVNFPLPTAGPPPTPPGSLSGTGGIGTASLTWTAASSGAGISNYNLHRSTTSGFTPTSANRIAQPAGLTYTDSGLAGGTYYYVVTAEDINHLVSGPSVEALVTVLADTQPPQVTLTAPSSSSITGSVTVSATASDDIAVAGVQFLLDGGNLGAEITSPPYSMSWNSTGTTNGNHTLAARARDTGGNIATTPVFNISVSNTQLSGLVAAYSFSEGSGNTVLDQSGNGNNGSITAATWSTSGKTGNALSFNGTSARVTVPDASSLRLTNGMTLEAWVRPTVSTNWRTIILKEDSNELAYSLYGGSDNNRPGTWIRLSNGSTQTARGTAQLAVNTWTHVAATYNGSALRVFVNGTQVSSVSVTGNILVTSGPLQIGGNQVWGEYFQGLIDDVRVYNRALSPAEIQSDMNLPVAP